MKNTFERLRTLMWFLKKKKETSDQLINASRPSAVIRLHVYKQNNKLRKRVRMKKCETKWSRAALGLRAGSDLISFTWRETWLHSAASVKLDRPAAGDQSQWRDDELTSRLFHVNVDLLFDLVLFFSSVATDGTWTVFSMMFWTGSIWFKPEIWFTQLHFNSVARLMCSQRFKYIF